VNRLRKTIAKAFADLDALGCSWAVVGGLALVAEFDALRRELGGG
jgi:hypothetical protein